MTTPGHDTPVERVRQALEAHGHRTFGTGITLRAVCPVHESHGSLTLSATKGRNGAVLYCWAGCETADIIAAIGLTWGDLFDNPAHEPSTIRHDRPVTEQDRIIQDLTRTVRIINMTTDSETTQPAPDADRALGFAEAEEAAEAAAHWLTTRARHAALATDDQYVTTARKTPPGKRSYEQTAVLVLTTTGDTQ